jgi:hypothetical protein
MLATEKKAGMWGNPGESVYFISLGDVSGDVRRQWIYFCEE